MMKADLKATLERVRAEQGVTSDPVPALLEAIAQHLLVPTDARVNQLQARCNELLLEVRAMRIAASKLPVETCKEWLRNVEALKEELSR